MVGVEVDYDIVDDTVLRECVEWCIFEDYAHTLHAREPPFTTKSTQANPEIRNMNRS